MLCDLLARKLACPQPPGGISPHRGRIPRHAVSLTRGAHTGDQHDYRRAANRQLQFANAIAQAALVAAPPPEIRIPPSRQHRWTDCNSHPDHPYCVWFRRIPRPSETVTNLSANPCTTWAEATSEKWHSAPSLTAMFPVMVQDLLDAIRRIHLVQCRVVRPVSCVT